MDSLAAFFFVIGATFGIFHSSCEDYWTRDRKTPVEWCGENFATKLQIEKCVILWEK